MWSFGNGTNVGAQGLSRKESRGLRGSPAHVSSPYSQVQPEALAAAVRRGPAFETISTSYWVPGVRAEKLVLSASAPMVLTPAWAPSWYRVTW